MSADPRRPSTGDDFAEVAEKLRRIEQDLSGLKDASGTQLFRSVEKLSGLVANIQTELELYNATRYTNDQVDAKIAAPASIDVQGAARVRGALTVDGISTLTGAVTSAGVADTNVTTGSWATMVVRTDAAGRGVIGYNASTRGSKNVDDDLELDVDDVLEALRPVRFRYFVDPQPTEDGRPTIGPRNIDRTPRVGVIAEDVATLLPELVVLDAGGDPLTVDYPLIGVAAIAALGDAVTEYRSKIAALEARLDRLDGGCAP